MSNKQYGSKTSLEYETRDKQTEEQYEEIVSSLRMQKDMVENALRMAENLIQEYQRENEELRYRNKQLQTKLQTQNQQIEQLKQILIHRESQSTRIQEQISIFLEQKQVAEKKIQYLSHELNKCHQSVTSYKNHQKYSFESKLNNYFSFPVSQKFNQSQVAEPLIKEIKSLKQRLDDKDEEILLILKRNKAVEEKLINLLEKQKKSKQSKGLISKNLDRH